MSEFSFSSPYIDTNDALKRVMGNQTLLVRMLRLFLSSEEPRKVSLLVEEKNLPAAGDAAHAVKGIAGNLGMGPLMAVSAALMEALRQGTPWESLYAQYQETLLETTKEVEALLQQLGN